MTKLRERAQFIVTAMLIPIARECIILAAFPHKLKRRCDKANPNSQVQMWFRSV